MFITDLKIHNFRNLVNREFNFNNRVNIFYGKNGVGKTSILESINFLSSGKSFRKSTSTSLINHKSTELTVYLNVKDNQENETILAVSKNKKGQWKAKKNNNRITKQSEINSIIPVISIDPEVLNLVDMGPSTRRSYLDWLVFHVKHDYLTLWKKVFKCTKQLNSLYKSNAKADEIKQWEIIYVKYVEELNSIRLHYFNQIESNIINMAHKMLCQYDSIKLSYKQGWPSSNSFENQLDIDRKRNIQYGQLQHGPHKMDIGMSIDGVKASNVLSRGQKKILSMSFYMAYVDFLKTQHNITPIVCLDDFDAELDDDMLKKVAHFFYNTSAQLFITSVNKEKIKKVFKEYAMFHVKHS